jgi:hypothetical protein
LADIVAKIIFASRLATLIQEIDLARKIDSIDAPVGFDSCAVRGGRRLLQQNRPLADMPAAPIIHTSHSGSLCAENLIRIDWPKESSNVSAP